MSKKNKTILKRRTDSGNAEHFASLCGNRVRFDHKQQRWLIWDMSANRWAEDVRDEVILLMKESVRDRLGIAFKSPESDERTKEIKWALSSENCNRIEAALKLARSEPPLSDSGEGWNADPWLFGVSNGVVDLRIGTLRQERPEDKITKHSPVHFDPSALCPRFELFLNQIFNGDMALVDYVQRVVGYCLTGLVEEQCVFCKYGSGANGKTTLLAVLAHILGEYAVNLPFSALELKNRNSNDLVALSGARLATASETNEGMRLNEARIKMLTGGDAITARKLYREAFTFEPTHKLVLAFNHKPVIADNSEGMWRRVHLIPYERRFSAGEQDKGLLDKLKAEASGVLAWAVRGCLLWKTTRLGMPQAIVQATATYRDESDHIGEFVEDCCVVEAGATVSAGALRQRYEQWAADNEEVPLAPRSLCERLERRSFQRKRSGHGGTRIWVGVRLNGEHGDRVAQGDAVFVKSINENAVERVLKPTSPDVTASPPGSQLDLGEFAFPVSEYGD